MTTYTRTIKDTPEKGSVTVKRARKAARKVRSTVDKQAANKVVRRSVGTAKKR